MTETALATRRQTTAALTTRQRRANRRAAAHAASHDLAAATQDSYARSWAQWESYCVAVGKPPLPADPATLAEWLGALVRRGLKPGSVKVRAAGVSYYHRQAVDEHGDPFVDPTKHPGVMKVLRGDRRDRRHTPKQAQPLTADDLTEIATTLRIAAADATPDARLRATRDLALLRTLWSGLLRRSEAAALTWGDVALAGDDDAGISTLTIRQSKSDQEGQGAVVPLTPKTTAALVAWRDASHPDGAPDDDAPLFATWRGDERRAMSSSQIGRVVAARAKQAGLVGNYSGHSGRVGMAKHLVAKKATLPELTQAGRWADGRMAAHYAKAGLAQQGTVARLCADQ